MLLKRKTNDKALTTQETKNKEMPEHKEDSNKQSTLPTFESCLIEDAIRSEKRAWRVAGAAVFTAVLLTVAVIVMTPLKETTPYVIKVDSAGAVDILTTLKNKPMSYDEALDKYWLAKYVRAYESWEYYTAQEDYEFVGLTSAPPVAKQYALLFEGPRAIDQLYGVQTIAIAKIISVVPTDNGIAQIRFEKNLKTRNAPEVQGQTQRWIATIGYEYKKVSKMKESERLKNPLGFHVTSYRVDPEISDTVPTNTSSIAPAPSMAAVPATPQGGAR